MRIITRLNIGGPAYHVSILSGRLDLSRYDTLLVAGSLGKGEGSAEDLASRYGARLESVHDLRPEIKPIHDFRALRELAAVVRRFQPHIVHTHTAKAGTLGRAAALIASRQRPILVHTFHGHVLDRFFGRVGTHSARTVERGLARYSDCLVCVSESTVSDLVRFGIAPRSKFRVVPLGLDLDEFLAIARDNNRSTSKVNLIFCGRLVPTKRVELLLRAVAQVRSSVPGLQLTIVGDGVLLEDLTRLAQELSLEGTVTFLGFRRDIRDLLAAADLAILTSSSEGTPVFLIEAAAAGLPAIATGVDGVPDVVSPSGGILVPPEGEEEIANAIVRLATDSALRLRMGASARDHVRERFSSDRLLADIDRLYADLLAASRTGTGIGKRS